MNQTSAMTIGQLAGAAGVGVETVRYYQRLKLIPEPKRAFGSVRRYGDDIVQRIAFIKRAQRLGFTLSEIKTLFSLDAKRDRQRAHKLVRPRCSRSTSASPIWRPCARHWPSWSTPAKPAMRNCRVRSSTHSPGRGQIALNGRPHANRFSLRPPRNTP